MVGGGRVLRRGHVPPLRAPARRPRAHAGRVGLYVDCLDCAVRACAGGRARPAPGTKAAHVSPPEDEAAAQLLERLLADPAYRAAFRADPVTTSRAAGVESVARELATGRRKVMQTLDD